MQIHQLKTNKTGKKRIGRGGKRGTYSGKGVKGQKSRAGAKIRPAIRDFIQRIHKLRGVPARRYKKQGSVSMVKTYIVNFKDLDKKFMDGDIISVKSLLEKKMVRKFGGQEPVVKILGNGKLSKKLKFEGVKMSKKAQEKTK